MDPGQSLIFAGGLGLVASAMAAVSSSKEETAVGPSLTAQGMTSEDDPLHELAGTSSLLAILRRRWLVDDIISDAAVHVTMPGRRVTNSFMLFFSSENKRT